MLLVSCVYLLHNTWQSFVGKHNFSYQSMEVLRYWTHSSTLRGSQLNEETAGSKLFALTLYTTLWASMYRIQLSLWSHRTAEWRCRVVSLTHGTLVTYLSYYSQCVEGPSVFGIEPGLPNNNTQVFIAKLCLGYFIFDLVWCLCYQTEPPIMIVHHVLSIFGTANMIFQGKWGTELVAVIGATEVSNPLLQLRWFLKSAGYSKTILGEIVDFLFIIVFGAFRFLLSGY
ncbi:TMEM136 [Bugula neritina]|uniref:TMEM136 n=1 Tax=Bugula neritina TaxID=10212 RepID=A0A7J7JJA0_BUGNE|nr:TMEM136 [Bugula neritina]